MVGGCFYSAAQGKELKCHSSPYRPLSLELREPSNLSQFSRHRLATPVSPWERLKIGCGTPPVLTRHGWLIVYHGVSEMEGPSEEVHPLCYSAGVRVLSKDIRK
jgi:predicted GH43/DUF377 family glycosyl hydrolase